MKRTLTWDQGVEMARHQDLAATTGIQIYFAERCSPWQRGANRTTTACCASTSPRAPTCPSTTDAHVSAVMHELNTRPRKTLGYDTPAARFRAEARRRQPDMPAPAGCSAI